MKIREHIKWASKGGNFKLQRLFLLFCLSTLAAAAIVSIYAKASGKSDTGYSPDTVSGMFVILLFMAVPNNIIELLLIYTVYYLSIKLISAYTKGIYFIIVLILHNFVYFYLVQAVLGGIAGNVDEYNFIQSLQRIDYVYGWFTIVYMMQINITFFIPHKYKGTVQE